MKLLALQPIHDIGTIEAGQVFHVENEEHGLRLIASAQAALPETRIAWSKLSWLDFTVVIIASGPSLTAADCLLVQEWRQRDLQSRRVIVINTSYLMAPWADVLYACDGKWWEHYYPKVKAEFSCGALWTQDEIASRKFGLNYVPSIKGQGLCRKIGYINQGQNSGFQALGLAFQTGAARIILLGFDMKEGRHGVGHWHPDHPGRLHSFPNFDYWMANFAAMAKDLSSTSVKVVNATRSTAMKCFPLVPLEEVLQ